MPNISKVTPQQAQSSDGCLILDVRTGIEHRAAALQKAHLHIPLDELDAARFIADHHLDGSKPLYILCRAGGRAAKAAESFRAQGLENVHVIEGGMLACETCGVPVATTSAISLERQVRIVVGAVVLLGVVLGAVFSPWFYALSGVMGAGLLFAGVTDWCGMAFLLAKAPWNRKPA